MEVIYDNNDYGYKKFNLEACQNKLTRFYQGKYVDGVSKNNYFILSKKVIEKDEWIFSDGKKKFRVNKEDCAISNFDLLNKHNFVIGSHSNSFELISHEKEYIYCLNEFRNLIIDVDFFWAIELLKTVQDFLKNRRSAKSDLLYKEIIQVMLGDVVMHMKSAEKYRDFSDELWREDVSDYQFMAMQELQKSVLILAKLHGGRSFLTGNVLEMMMVFEYFYDVYFKE